MFLFMHDERHSDLHIIPRVQYRVYAERRVKETNYPAKTTEVVFERKGIEVTIVECGSLSN